MTDSFMDKLRLNEFCKFHVGSRGENVLCRQINPVSNEEIKDKDSFRRRNINVT